MRLPPELAAAAEGAAADETLSETYGVNALRGWVRAHPEVAARHYPASVLG